MIQSRILIKDRLAWFNQNVKALSYQKNERGNNNGDSRMWRMWNGCECIMRKVWFSSRRWFIGPWWRNGCSNLKMLRMRRKNLEPTMLWHWYGRKLAERIARLYRNPSIPLGSSLFAWHHDQGNLACDRLNCWLYILVNPVLSLMPGKDTIRD